MGFKSGFQKVHNAIGFKKGYNFVFFCIFNGTLLGFTLSRIHFINIKGQFCGPNGAGAGECYNYLDNGRYYVGIILHLGCILPGALFIFTQFIPIIRHKFLWFHRISGYISILLSLISNAGAFMIARGVYGGAPDIQVSTGIVGVLTTGAIFIAYYNIKRLQIDQHRAWMLRAFSWMASIITTRYIFWIAARIFSFHGYYHQIWECARLDFTLGEETTLSKYPSCAGFYDGSNPKAMGIVTADWNGSAEEKGASVGITFGMGFFLALILHILATELYLQLTPNESARLRDVSYQRQLEAGFKNPGMAGLTADRWGDCDRRLGSTSQSSETTNEEKTG